jgi:hypothetical protein
MVILRICQMSLALAPLLLVVLGGACTSESVPPNGRCIVDPGAKPGCNGAVDGGPSKMLGLVGYSCTGSARPDEDPKYNEGVPEGLVCANQQPLDTGGTRDYCCTAETTSCAYNPVAACDSASYGYQCQGANRPESLNPDLRCGQGVVQGDLINYCCSGTPQPPACLQSDSVVCSPRLLGWTCLGDDLPRAEQLGASKSRADYYYLLCPTATPASNPKYNNYCCYTPALVPLGGSCVAHTTVPGCEPGRFGFACYGPDTPEDDYLPMHCPDRGFPGRSAEGYPATLYCCDFK